MESIQSAIFPAVFAVVLQEMIVAKYRRELMDRIGPAPDEEKKRATERLLELLLPES